MWPAALFKLAGETIHSGGVIAYPTEGVYGVGCAPEHGDAVARICRLKQRPLSAGLILIAADVWQLAGYIDPDPDELKYLLADADLPITWVVNAGPLSPDWVTGGRETVAVRITDHPVAAALCRAAASPLISTSANRRGRPPARRALQVRRWFPQLDLVVPGQVGSAAGPSEIRDARSGRTLRAG
ncbi:MAG: Sua5/YciO/YrdC/YwlC family protein [Gammaproteobacteria bacterium]|nr:Sua5/YciO/YrdC/YwlC family protein [Gammaproteobacteria bacterium]